MVRRAIDRLHNGLALVVVLEEVPLVEEYHQGTAALDREISNLLVLLRHARGGVDDEQRDVRAIDSAKPSDHGVVLDILIDRALLADARGIDHAIALAVALDNRVDGSRVVPAILLTMERSLPIILLKSEDLPAFARR